MPRTVMNLKPAVDLTGGESVYCINESQMRKALAMLEAAGNDSRLRATYEELRTSLDRNEQAALAFLLIDALRNK